MFLKSETVCVCVCMCIHTHLFNNCPHSSVIVPNLWPYYEICHQRNSEFV